MLELDIEARPLGRHVLAEKVREFDNSANVRAYELAQSLEHHIRNFSDVAELRKIDLPSDLLCAI